jgi:hypothetical protein
MNKYVARIGLLTAPPALVNWEDGLETSSAYKDNARCSRPADVDGFRLIYIGFAWLATLPEKSAQTGINLSASLIRLPGMTVENIKSSFLEFISHNHNLENLLARHLPS